MMSEQELLCAADLSKRQILDGKKKYSCVWKLSGESVTIQTRCSLLGNHFYNKLSGLVCHDFHSHRPPCYMPSTHPRLHSYFSLKLHLSDCSSLPLSLSLLLLFFPSCAAAQTWTCCNADLFYLGLLALIQLQQPLEKAFIINTD